MAGSLRLRQVELETPVLPDGTSLLFDPDTDAGHVLDALGSLAWDYYVGALSADDITDEVAGLSPEDNRLPSEVRRVLAKVAEGGALACEPRSESPAKGPLPSCPR